MTVSPADDIQPASHLDPSRIRQRERFNWFADRLERWDGHYDVSELRAFLDGEAEWPGQREKALVLLALSGTDEAREVLEGLDLEDKSESFCLLYQIARRHARGDDRTT